MSLYELFYGSATENICADCIANPYKTITECLDDMDECPYKKQISMIRARAKELAQLIEATSKQAETTQYDREVYDEEESFNERFTPFVVNEFAERISNW